MTLQLKVEIISEDTMIPFTSFSCTLDIIMYNLVRDFACNTSRTHNQSFMILLKLLTVCSGTIVITIYPRIRYKFNKVLVPCIVLCQYDKMVARIVMHTLILIMHCATCYIHLTSEDRLERLFTLLFPTFIDLSTIVSKLFYAEHYTMISNRHTLHSVCNSLINKACNLRLTIKNRIIGVDV